MDIIFVGIAKLMKQALMTFGLKIIFAEYWAMIYIYRPGARCHRVFEKKSTFSCNAKSGAWKRKALPLFFRKKKEDFQLKHEQEC